MQDITQIGAGLVMVVALSFTAGYLNAQEYSVPRICSSIVGNPSSVNLYTSNGKRAECSTSFVVIRR